MDARLQQGAGGGAQAPEGVCPLAHTTLPRTWWRAWGASGSSVQLHCLRCDGARQLRVLLKTSLSPHPEHLLRPEVQNVFREHQIVCRGR